MSVSCVSAFFKSSFIYIRPHVSRTYRQQDLSKKKIARESFSRIALQALPSVLYNETLGFTEGGKFVNLTVNLPFQRLFRGVSRFLTYCISGSAFFFSSSSSPVTRPSQVSVARFLGPEILYEFLVIYLHLFS